MNLKKANRGFTAVEIIIVLAVLALATAAAIPVVLNSAKEAKMSGLPAEARAIYLAAQTVVKEQAEMGNNISVIKSEIPKGENTTLRDRMKELLGKEISGYASYEATVENGKVSKIVYQKTVAGKDKTITLEIGKGEDGDDLVTIINTPPKEKNQKQ